MKKILILLVLFIYSNTFAKDDILILSSNMGKVTQESKGNELINVAKLNNLSVDFKFENDIKDDELTHEFSKYKIILFDSLSGSREVNSMLEKYSSVLKSLEENTIIIPISIKDENPYRKNISIEDNITLNEYWYNGGTHNFKNFSLFINNKILKKNNKEFEPPIIIPENGIYHPKNPKIVFSTIEEYAKFFNIDLENPKKPLIGIGLHRGSLVSNALEHINEMISYLEKKVLILFHILQILREKIL